MAKLLSTVPLTAPAASIDVAVGATFTMSENFTLSGSGASPTVTLYWQFDQGNGTWIDIPTSGATGLVANSGSQASATEGTTYSRTITCMSGGLVPSYVIRAKGVSSTPTTVYSVNQPTITPTSDPGNWIERQPKGDVDANWYAGACGGNYMLAGEYPGRLYLSSDGGGAWVEVRPSGDANYYWRACAIDGENMVVATDAGPYPFSAKIGLYLSKNHGVTWTEVRPQGDVKVYWQGVAISGANIIVAASGGLWISSDTGTTWTKYSPGGVATNYWSCGVSGDLIIIGIYGGRIYTSANAGVTWTERQPAGDTTKYWTGCACYGAYMLACADYGRVYRSTNSGVTWAEVYPAGDLDGSWWSCAIGSNYALLGQGGGPLFSSVDNGSSWSMDTPLGSLDAVTILCCATAGTHAIVGIVNDRLYTEGPVTVTEISIVHSFPWIGRFQLCHKVE